MNAKESEGAKRRRARETNVLERQISILEAISASGDGLLQSEIAEVVGLPKATVHRLMAMLVEAGLVVARGRRRKAYVVGPRLTRLLHAEIEMNRLQRLADAPLHALVARFQETAYLARFMGTEVRSIAMAVPEREWRGHVYPGNTMPFCAVASAKAIFAFQPPEVLARAMKAPLMRFTPFTKTDPEAIHHEFAMVRARGFATCREEIDMGIIAYACPINLPNVGVIYSVGLTGPIGRIDKTPEAEIVAALKKAADQLASRIARMGRVESRME